MKCLIVLSQNTSQMNLINKLANSIEKSVILLFVNEHGLNDLKGFEFDRPAIGFVSGLEVARYFKFSCWSTYTCIFNSCLA